MAQFSPVEWMLRRNCLILPTSCPIVPSATPKLSKPPTMKNPSFNCGSFDNVTAFLGSSSKTSQVVLINLSLGCSALPDTNLNVERRMGGWKIKYLVQCFIWRPTYLKVESNGITRLGCQAPEESVALICPHQTVVFVMLYWGFWGK